VTGGVNVSTMEVPVDLNIFGLREAGWERTRRRWK